MGCCDEGEVQHCFSSARASVKFGGGEVVSSEGSEWMTLMLASMRGVVWNCEIAAFNSGVGEGGT